MSVKEYLWNIFIKKVITGAILGFLASYGGNLNQAGIAIDQQLLISAVVGLLNGARNYAKIKLGWKFLP